MPRQRLRGPRRTPGNRMNAGVYAGKKKTSGESKSCRAARNQCRRVRDRVNSSASRGGARWLLLLRLLRDVSGREGGAFAKEKIFHVLGDEILRFLLPRHQPVLVQDHLHPLFPELP